MSKIIDIENTENTEIDNDSDNDSDNDNESNNESNSEIDDNNMSFFQDNTIPLDRFDNIIKEVNLCNSELSKINIENKKEMEKVQKIMCAFFSSYREINNNYLIFMNNYINNVKKNIKDEKKKLKKNKDKSKYSVNKPKNAPLFILKYLGKNENEKVSQSEVLKFLIQKIKGCIEQSPTKYAVFKDNGKIDKTNFKIENDLQDFFSSIKKEALLRGDEIDIPPIIGYTKVMGLMKYFVYKDN